MARAGLAALTEHDGAVAAALHVELADHAYTVRNYESSRRHAETAAALARDHRDQVGESHALAQAALASLFLGDQHEARRQATTAADLVDAAGDSLLSTNLDALLQLGMTEGILERLDDAERHLKRAAALCLRTGQVYVEPDVLTVLSNTQLRSGRLRAALATLDRADAVLAGGGAPVTEAIIAMVRAETLFWQGGTDGPHTWQASAARALEIVDGSQAAWAVSVSCFHAELALHAGTSDPAHARWLLLDAAGGDELSRVAGWRKPRWCDALARAAAAASDPAGTAHWAELAESCAGQLPSAGRRAFAHRVHGCGTTPYGATSAERCAARGRPSRDSPPEGNASSSAARCSTRPESPSPRDARRTWPTGWTGPGHWPTGAARHGSPARSRGGARSSRTRPGRPRRRGPGPCCRTGNGRSPTWSARA